MTNIPDETPLTAAVPKQSKYLAKEDVPSPRIETMKGMESVFIESQDGDKRVTILHFMGNLKPMVLNVTNRDVLIEDVGVRTAGEVRGKQIEIWVDKSVSFGGKRVGGLRLRPAGAAAADEENQSQQNQATTSDQAPEFDDDIPF